MINRGTHPTTWCIAETPPMNSLTRLLFARTCQASACHLRMSVCLQQTWGHSEWGSVNECMPVGDLYRLKDAFCGRRSGSRLNNDSYCFEVGPLWALKRSHTQTWSHVSARIPLRNLYEIRCNQRSSLKANDFRLFAEVTAQEDGGKNKVVGVLVSNESNLLRLVG